MRLEGDQRRSWRRERGGLLVLLVLVATIHSPILWRAPERALHGDERGYMSNAYEDANRSETSLLPSKLRFAWRPEFGSRFFAQFIDQETEQTEALRYIGVAHLLLLLALIFLMHEQARWLGLSRIGALTVAATLGLFPWFGIYVHLLWPEILHAFLLGLGLFLVHRYLLDRRRVWLFLGGLATGYALLTKGAVNAFVPVMIVFATWTAVDRERRQGSSAMRSLGVGGLAGGVLLVAVLLVVLPQMRRNAADGHGYRLSSNRWINIEIGLMRAPRVESAPHFFGRYRRSGKSAAVREAKSRERVFEYLRETPTSKVLWDQTQKMHYLIFGAEAFTEEVNDLWPGLETWMGIANVIGRVMWYWILFGGTAGLFIVVTSRAGPLNEAWILLTLLTGYFAFALFVVPGKIRFALPLIPVLSFFCGALIDWLLRMPSNSTPADPTTPSPTTPLEDL